MAQRSERLELEAHRQSKANVLLVDDNSANLLALRAILDDLGQNLVDARSGEEALERVQRDEFAVILLDVLMPGMDGFETAQRIRRQPRSTHTPIIFLSSRDSDGSQLDHAYRLGAVDFLIKPVAPVVLKAKVAGLVELFEEKRRAQREGEQFRLLVESTKDYAIFMLDPDGYIVTWNPGAERIKQYRAEEIIGQHFSRFYPREALEKNWPAHELMVARKEGRFEEERWRVRKDGSQFWANVIITALYDKAGHLRGFSKITRDMTDRKRAEENARRLVQEEAARKAAEENARIIQEQQELLRVTLASIGDAVIATDTQGRVTFLNPVAQALTGWAQDDAARQPLETVFPILHEHTRQPVENPVAKVLREGVIIGLGNHTVLIARDGVERPIDDSAAPIRDAAGAIIGVVLVFRDVTERRQVEQQLLQADQRKDEFLATLAHELRNPLAPIRNALEVMNLAREDRQAVEECRSMMERQVVQMVRLVDDLMDISRITRNKLDLRKQRVELTTVVASAVETSRPLMAEAGHRFTITLPAEPVYLDVDPTRLAQVFANLLNNSAKYTDPGGRIELTAECAAGQVTARVRDNGIGIPAEALPRLFEMFSQVERNLDRTQGGLGIGLTLVRRLVEMHGGTVEARSKGLGHGSEFVVTLPTVPGDDGRTEAPSAAHQGKPAAHKRRILVVDDNHDSAASLSMMLSMMGNEARTAHDGLEAVNVAAEFRPHLILLDIGMPKLSGYDACRRIREQPWGKDIVIVALTGWGQDEDRRRSHEAGFDHHIVKPVEPAALEKLLAGLGT